MGDGFANVGLVESHPVGSSPVDVTETVREVAADADARILTRLDDGIGAPEFASIARTCTHSGCNVLVGGAWGTSPEPLYDSAAQVLTCPCHGSRFNVATGAIVRGPARSPLRVFATEVRGDYVYVAIEGADA